MQVARRNGTAVIVLDDGPPVNFCKPAVDPLFSSAAEVWGSWNLALILTGMGSDGTNGAAADRRGRRQRDRAGRGDQRDLGHARLGGRGRRVLGGAAARADRAEDRSVVPWGEAVTP